MPRKKKARKAAKKKAARRKKAKPAKKRAKKAPRKRSPVRGKKSARGGPVVEAVEIDIVGVEEDGGGEPDVIVEEDGDDFPPDYGGSE